MRTRAIVSMAVLSCAIVSGGWLMQRGLSATGRSATGRFDGGHLFAQVKAHVLDERLLTGCCASLAIPTRSI